MPPADFFTEQFLRRTTKEEVLELKFSLMEVVIAARLTAHLTLTSVLSLLKEAFPLQAWTCPWGSRRLRLQNF
jgi:hypothetical protein